MECNGDNFVNCKHWSDCGVPSGGCCAAGHFGGKPSLGVCASCPHANNDRPGIVDYIKAVPSVLVASVTADSPMSKRRLAICKGCDQWDGSRCRQCGCFTGLKVRLPAEACPIGKWHAEG